jgi:hypothetical protein
MGSVYLLEHAQLPNTFAAMKVLKAGAASPQAMKERFVQEALVAADIAWRDRSTWDGSTTARPTSSWSTYTDAPSPMPATVRACCRWRPRVKVDDFDRVAR